jgi:hypothetical protein
MSDVSCAGKWLCTGVGYCNSLRLRRTCNVCGFGVVFAAVCVFAVHVCVCWMRRLEVDSLLVRADACQTHDSGRMLCPGYDSSTCWPMHMSDDVLHVSLFVCRSGNTQNCCATLLSGDVGVGLQRAVVVHADNVMSS